MKKKWSNKWSASVQPRKQRKFRHNAPLHVRQKLVSAHLSQDLRKKFGKRSIPIRKNDDIVVKRGSFKGTRGSVSRVDLMKGKVYLEEIKVKKVDGSEVHRPLEPSNLVITKINLDDKRRQAIMERADKSGKGERKEEKPKEEPKKEEPRKEKKRSKAKPKPQKKKPVKKAKPPVKKKPKKGGKG
jgi:large subunit ribosomal protein L24